MSETQTALALLRAAVDAADRDLLQAIARRMALVREIGGVKRAAGLRIRDPRREEEVLADRVRLSSELGLPAAEMESLFRLLMRASRDVQAMLRVEVHANEAPHTVAVIGGEGRMGRLMANLFADLGHQVVIADVKTTLRPVEAAAAADVVVISVPIATTEEVIHEVGPHVRPDACLLDVTSVKEGPMTAMMHATTASVVGTHPLFGPSVHTVQGQRVVLCRGRGDEWANWVARTFASHGMIVTEATPAHHDRVMSIVQVLTHFQTQVMGLALARSGVPLVETLEFTSPVYLLELYTTARHFAQAPTLYGPIEMRNPRSSEVTRAVQDAAAELAGVIARGDQAAFTALFEEVRGFFGDFTTRALEQSSYLVDRIVERT